MGWVAHEILVSAQGPLVLGFGARGLGPGLDNIYSVDTQYSLSFQKPNILGIQYSVQFDYL